MTSKATDENVLAILPSIVEGLHQIGVLSRARSDQASGALTAIGVIYHTLRAGMAGELNAETVARALKTLELKIDATDAKHDAALAAKFDTSEEG